MKIINESFEKNLRDSYLSYAVSVITSRAIPDVRDGLKPVQRRILYSMYELGLLHNRPHKKSARIVGETLGKYHPHGDMAIYDALVRMAQSFSMNYPLIDGQGNFGSVDNDPPAAMRYTEARLSSIAEELFRDIEYGTVEFVDNFDNSLKEPRVLPSRFPNVLVNGSSGIAVGLTTEIPPHNLSEIIDATIALVKGLDPLEYIQGPDFPTGGVIYSMDRDYMISGTGKIELVSRYRIEDNKIYITEIPYGIPKTKILQDLYEVKESGKVKGIRNIIDRSSKDIEIEITVDRNYNPQSIINTLLNQTSLRRIYNVKMVVLDGGKPVTLGIVDILRRFIDFRKSIIVKRAEYFRSRYMKSLERVESYIYAIQNIDSVVRILREEESPERKLEELGLSKERIEHIMNMNLKYLKKENLDALIREKQELETKIGEQENIINNPIPTLIQELEEIKRKYGKGRKTQIEMGRSIEGYDYRVGIVYSQYGLKKVPEIQIMSRGRRSGLKYGEGILGALITNDNSQIAIFTRDGMVYRLNVKDLDMRGREDDFETLQKYGMDGDIVKILPYREGDILILTERGGIKRTHLRMGRNSTRIISKSERIVDVNYASSDYVTIVSREGKAIRFRLDDLREAGRGAGGVRGIRGTPLRVITSERFVVGFRNGYIKVVDELRVTNRGGKGVFVSRSSKRAGEIADACNFSDELLVIIQNNIARVKIQEFRSTRRGIGLKEFNQLTKIYNL
ncbi:MAG: DNA gyrase subunit A [Candidatus Micrarchaeota archaeon]|nr:DNA gyrase subunit A [Candidatus Micrarchaeota archaeon]MCX8154624.1 DNA gyrase subunit A [Candidatus Micrarchaeota archaeon]